MDVVRMLIVPRSHFYLYCLDRGAAATTPTNNEQLGLHNFWRLSNNNLVLLEFEDFYNYESEVTKM